MKIEDIETAKSLAEGINDMNTKIESVSAAISDIRIDKLSITGTKEERTGSSNNQVRTRHWDGITLYFNDGENNEAIQALTKSFLNSLLEIYNNKRSELEAKLAAL